MSHTKRLFILLIILFATRTLFLTAQSDSLPEDFPEITINDSSNPSDGWIYLANFKRGTMDDPENLGAYLIAVDNAGVVQFHQAVEGLRAFNFHPLDAAHLYYYNLTSTGLGGGAAMDGTHRIIDFDGNLLDEIPAPQGAQNTAPHDFILLENGNMLLISQPVRQVDLTEFDGHPEALVADASIYEITPPGEIIFEWHSTDHIPIEDTARPQVLTTEPPEAVSYLHPNGMTLDLDGNIILSARRLDELIKIDRETGEIIWRMGGPTSKRNEFTFINDPFNGFSGQHHPTILPNGNLLLFDNGDTRPEEDRVSRAVEYAIDEGNRTATMVWQFLDVQGRYTPTLGSAQRLPNGNTLIGWGSAPPTGASMVEVTPEGEVVFALSLPETQMTYRAFRFPALHNDQDN